MSSLRGPVDRREAPPQHRDDAGGVAHRQRGLGRVGELVGIGHRERLGLGDGLDQEHRARRHLAHGADHLGMAGMADQQHGAAVLVMPLDLAVDLGDQRAGGVGEDQLAAAGLGRHRLGHAVRREHHQRVVRHLVELLDEHRALARNSSTTWRLWTISCRT